MKITTIGRQMEVSEELKALFDKKLAKFDKFFKDDAVAHITLSKKRNMETLELTISSGGILYRAEEENSTFQNALDSAIDSIERQIRKHKTRLGKRLREGAFVRDASAIPLLKEEAEEDDFKIRIKEFSLKPMTSEEAILQMNLLGHSFFMFDNIESGNICVVYKRKDDDYGMIIPK